MYRQGIYAAGGIWSRSDRTSTALSLYFWDASATKLDVVVARERLEQSVDVEGEDVDVVEHAWGGGGSDGAAATCGQSVIGAAKRLSVNS